MNGGMENSRPEKERDPCDYNALHFARCTELRRLWCIGLADGKKQGNSTEIVWCSGKENPCRQ